MSGLTLNTFGAYTQTEISLKKFDELTLNPLKKESVLTRLYDYFMDKICGTQRAKAKECIKTIVQYAFKDEFDVEITSVKAVSAFYTLEMIAGESQRSFFTVTSYFEGQKCKSSYSIYDDSGKEILIEFDTERNLEEYYREISYSSSSSSEIDPLTIR